MNKINFATFNICGGTPYPETQEYRNKSFDAKEYISGLIMKYALDIVCFQEILMEDEIHSSMSGEIAEASGLKFYEELALSDSHIMKGREMGISIVSRFPITQSRVFMLENPNIVRTLESGDVYRSHEKGFLITKIQTDTGELCCVTGHCFPFHSFGRDAMDFKYIYTSLEEELLKILEENRRIIIGADFNENRMILSRLMPQIFKQYKLLVNSSTRPNGREDDYIFCNSGNTHAEFRLIKTCFDHYGCMAVVEWKDEL